MQLSNAQKGLVILLAAAVLFGGVLFVNRILRAEIFSKEEAQHAVYGLWICKDLHALDWGNFWYDTQRQMYWPFLHSWALASFFLVFGIHYATARLLSLAIFLATLLLMYLVALHLSERSGWKLGLSAAALALTSPLALRCATECTLEGLGALIFLASYYFYTQCEERKVALEYVILGILIGLSIYTNYLFAYLMLPAFVVATLAKLGPLFFEGVHLAREGEKAALRFFWWAYKKLIVLGVLLIILAAWFLTSAFSRKVLLLMQAIFRQSGGTTETGFWQGLLYYPSAIIGQYAFSPWLGALILLALFCYFTAAAYRQMDKLFIFVWTVLLLAALTVPAKAPQIIYIISPFIYLVAAGVLFYALERWKKFSAALLVVVFLPALLALPGLGRQYFPARPKGNMGTVLNYFRRQLPSRQPVAALFSLQHLNPKVMEFHFHDWPVLVLAEEGADEDQLFRDGHYFLAVELGPDSHYRLEVLDDSIYRWNSFLTDKLGQGEVRETAFQNFPSLGLSAKIYEKTARN